MINRTRASIMKNLDAEVAMLIAQSRAISEMDGLRLFLSSETTQYA